jgi:phosphatidylserine decarboxylase
MFHKEGTKTIFLGMIFTAVLLLSDRFITIEWLWLFKVGPFDFNYYFTVFQKS